MSTDGGIAVELPAGMWAGIDATVDNAVSMAAVDGDEQTVTMGSAIREAGWAQVPWVDGQWPPRDHLIHISLGRAEWDFAVDQVRRSRASHLRRGDDEAVRRLDEAVALVTAQVG